MEAQENRGRYGRALGIFLLVILVCTVIARGADAMTLPKVEVEKAKGGWINYGLKGNGTVETKAKSTFLVPEGYLVEECLESGTGVKEGETLIRFQLEHLKKRREELWQTWREAVLALEQAKLNQQEDAWIPSAEEAQRSRKAAQEEYDLAWEALALAQEEYEKARAEYEGEESFQEGEEHLQDREASVGGQEATGRESPEQTDQRLAAAQEALTLARQRFDSAQAALEQADTAYRSAEKNDDAVRQNNAKAKKSAALSVESAQLAAEAAERRLGEAEGLLDQEGKLCASETGIFLNTAVTAGAVTSGCEFISIGTGELVFTADLPESAGEKVEQGDKISVKLPGKEKQEAVITDLSLQKGEEDGQEILVMRAALPKDEEPAVGPASFSLEKKSKKSYTTVLPLTAIRQDSRGYYCLGVREQDTILGKEQKAEEIRLTLLDQDDTKAAVEGAISEDTRIIVSSEKPVKDQDRVRIEKKS